MDLKSGYPYPLIKSGLPFDYPKLEQDIKTEVLVLGGGISGALTAWHLVNAGIDCVIMDARSIGLGSTCASTSLLQYEIDKPLTELTELVGRENAFRSYLLCAEAVIRLGEIANVIGLSDFRFKPSLNYALTEKELPRLKKEKELRDEIGLEVEYLEKSDIQERFGFDAPGGLLSTIAADTNAYLFTHLLHQHSISKGLRVFDRSAISGLESRRTGIKASTINGYSIVAKKIVYATGYESVQLIKESSVKLKTTFAVTSEALNNNGPYWFKDAVIWSTGDPYLYLRSTPDHRIFIGGKDISTISQKTAIKLLKSKTASLAKEFNKLFPSISFNPEFSWAGVFASTKDGLPFIGEHKRFPHSYFALGFGGNGITFSLIAAGIITGLIRGDKHSDAKLFSFDR